MWLFSLGDFFLIMTYHFFDWGGRGVWVAIKWGWGGGATLMLRLRLGIVLGVGYTQIQMFWGMFDTYILRKGCGAKWSVNCKPT